jgi:hypothetical protein
VKKVTRYDTPDVRQLKMASRTLCPLSAGYFDVTGESSRPNLGIAMLALQPNSNRASEGLNKAGKRAGPNELTFCSWSNRVCPVMKSVTIPCLSRSIRAWSSRRCPSLLIKQKTRLCTGHLQAAGKPCLSKPWPTRYDGTSSAKAPTTRHHATDHRARHCQVGGTRSGNEKGGTAAAFWSLSPVTEQADERAWRTLPERISVARAILPYGKQTLEFQTGKGVYRTEINIGNRFTVVPIRLTGGAVMVGEQNVISAMPVVQERPAKGRATTKGNSKKPAAAN